jgi:hypothetical protein
MHDENFARMNETSQDIAERHWVAAAEWDDELNDMAGQRWLVDVKQILDGPRVQVTLTLEEGVPCGDLCVEAAVRALANAYRTACNDRHNALPRVSLPSQGQE